MSGHGHVKPNADGSRARCGGPGICMECSLEADQEKLYAIGAEERPYPKSEADSMRQTAYEAAEEAIPYFYATPSGWAYSYAVHERRDAFLAGWDAHAERVRGLIEAAFAVAAGCPHENMPDEHGEECLMERIRLLTLACAAYDREGK